jgi:hypothetical protein
VGRDARAGIESGIHALLVELSGVVAGPAREGAAREVDGVVAAGGQQPHRLQRVQHVDEGRRARPAHAPHVKRRDERRAHVARKEEEEGRIAAAASSSPATPGCCT